MRERHASSVTTLKRSRACLVSFARIQQQKNKVFTFPVVFFCCCLQREKCTSECKIKRMIHREVLDDYKMDGCTRVGKLFECITDYKGMVSTQSGGKEPAGFECVPANPLSCTCGNPSGKRHMSQTKNRVLLSIIAFCSR